MLICCLLPFIAFGQDGNEPHSSEQSKWLDSIQNVLAGEDPVIVEKAERMTEQEFKKEKKKFEGYGNIIILSIIVLVGAFSVWAWKYKETYVKKNTVNGIYMGAGTAYFRSRYEKEKQDEPETETDPYSSWNFDDHSGGGASDRW